MESIKGMWKNLSKKGKIIVVVVVLVGAWIVWKQFFG